MSDGERCSPGGGGGTLLISGAPPPPVMRCRLARSEGALVPMLVPWRLSARSAPDSALATPLPARLVPGIGPLPEILDTGEVGGGTAEMPPAPRERLAPSSGEVTPALWLTGDGDTGAVLRLPFAWGWLAALRRLGEGPRWWPSEDAADHAVWPDTEGPADSVLPARDPAGGAGSVRSRGCGRGGLPRGDNRPDPGPGSESDEPLDAAAAGSREACGAYGGGRGVNMPSRRTLVSQEPRLAKDRQVHDDTIGLN